MEVISSKSFEEDSSDMNLDQNIYTNKPNNNLTEEDDDDELDNNLNEMEMNGINEINELDEEDEESENNYVNKNIEEHYEENEISNSEKNIENNTINTIDEENDENSNNSYLNEMKENQMPFIVPLIIFENDKYIINEKAKKLLGHLGNKKMGIISLFSNDKYYEDKFNIINKLMSNNLNNNNFFNLNHKNSIIIYTKPLIIKNNFNNNEEDLPCFILDTFNLDINVNNDYKIFIIMILISSIFIFISKDIDEDAFNYLNFLLKILKTIKIRNISEEDNINELNQFLPNLIR